VADAAGARSQLAQWVSAAVVLMCLLFLSRVIDHLPKAALGALIVAAAISMLRPKEFYAIARVHRAELVWALVTLVGVVVLGTLQGILVAVAISLLTLMHQANHPHVYAVAYSRAKDSFRPVGEDPDDETFPGLLMLRTEGRLNFANAANVSDKVQALIAEAQPRVIVLDCSAIPDIEYTALVMLMAAEQTLRERGISLWLARLNSELDAAVRHCPLGPALGDGRVFFTVHQALAAYLSAHDTRFAPPLGSRAPDASFGSEVRP
jgi:anti-anti-sigma factor